MSKTEFPKAPLSEVMTEAATLTAGRVIWCRFSSSPFLYYRAQQELPTTLNEMYQLSERALNEQRWKIAVLRVEAIPANGRPTDYKFLSYVRVPVKLGQSSLSKTDVFSYSHMMELMTGFYNPSTPDPMVKFPGHISDEIRIWERMKRLAEIRAREEYAAAPR
jgi:hypothetical protein